MIYVSYSQKDRIVVQKICHSLTEKGIQLFLDYEQLAGGDYAQELTKHIESADAILFFYSENTENSTWVKHEVEFSLSKNKSIIPVLLSKPEENSWLNFHLGIFKWILFEREDYISVVDNILSALTTLNYKRFENPPESKGTIDDEGFVYAPQHDQSKGIPFSRKTKKYGCATILILAIIVVLLYLTLYRVGAPNPSPRVNSIPNDTLSFPNNDYGQKDYLVLKQKETELKTRVDEQLLRLLQEIENPSAAGNGDYIQSIIHKIERILGEDSIPFPQDSINTRQGQLYAFYKYKETVYSVLDRRIAAMESELEKNFNNSFKGGQRENERRGKCAVANEYRSEDGATVLFLMLIPFFVGSGLMFLLLRVRKSRKGKIKLSSDIASKILIDGDLQKEIEPREIYTTHLENGEYLIDFEDRQDENRHKTFNHEVTAKDCKLLFANFLEESSKNGKSIKCFIAGSKTLQQERDALRAVTCVMYNKWDSKFFRILSYTFEDFKKEHTLVPPQELYNKFIEEEADWALFIIDGEVGGITVNEYRVAMDSFKKNGKPKILALAKVGSEDNEKVAEIRDEINKEHQYWTDYTDIVSLKYIFESTLNWDLIRMFQDK